MANRIDAASRLIEATPSTIYAAFAAAEAMKRWLPPGGMHGEFLDFDFREGGSYRMRLTYEDPTSARGKTDEDADEVTVRFTRLAFGRCIEQVVTFHSTDPAFAGDMRMTWEFEPRSRGTLVAVRCEDVPRGITPEDHQAGLQSTLGNLARFVEAAAPERR